jgi:LPXTG-motif cell wall-anchored protein
VSIADFAFAPSSITVGVGETVTWSNDDSTEHTATATDGSFDTGLLARGERGTATFDRPGTFGYLCQPHPFMKGTVRVVAQAAGDGDEAAAEGSGDASTGGETAASGSAQTGGGLPETGTDVPTLAIAGLGLLLIGLSGRRRSAVRNT